MKLDSILIYQDVDKRLYALEREVNTSEENKAVVKLKELFKEYTGGLIRLNADMDEAVKSAERQAEELKKLESQIEDMTHLSIEDAGIDELELYEKETAKLSAEVEAFKRNIDKNEAVIKEILQNFDEKVKQCAVCRRNLDAANAKLKALIDSKGQEVVEIKRRLADIKKDVPEDVMELYMQRRNNKKLPAFVEYDPKRNACGCGVMLLNDAVSKLQKSGDTVECQSCGRIIFVK